jgi:hypothetical protein
VIDETQLFRVLKKHESDHRTPCAGVIEAQATAGEELRAKPRPRNVTEAEAKRWWCAASVPPPPMTARSRCGSSRGAKSAPGAFFRIVFGRFKARRVDFGAVDDAAGASFDGAAVALDERLSVACAASSLSDPALVSGHIYGTRGAASGLALQIIPHTEVFGTEAVASF